MHRLPRARARAAVFLSLVLLGLGACRSGTPGLAPAAPVGPAPAATAPAPPPEPAPAPPLLVAVPAPMPAAQEPAPTEEAAPEEEPASEPERIQKEALDLCQSADELLGRGDVDAAIARRRPRLRPDAGAARQRRRHLPAGQGGHPRPRRLPHRPDLRRPAAARRRAHRASWDLALPIVDNEHVRREIRSFTTVERDQFLEAYRRSGLYRPMILARLEKAGLPEPAHLAAPRRELVQGEGPLAGERPRPVAVHRVDGRALRARPRRLGRRAARPREVHRRRDRAT